MKSNTKQAKKKKTEIQTLFNHELYVQSYMCEMINFFLSRNT